MAQVLVDRYELGDVIGAGGMAKVRLGVDQVLGRKVAVKVLDDAVAQSADPANRDRFLNEARSAASFSHPNAVAVYDAGEDAGVLFIVLELVEGESLAAKIARTAPLPVDEALHIAAQVLDALDAMHRAGVVHRDVKPANVLIDRGGQVKLTDFGIAKRLDEIDEALTSAGTVIGTPHYLAPEQAVGDTLGPPTDVYLVGAVLHEMLTGRRPPSVLSDAPGRSRAPGALRPGLPVALDRIVERSLAHRPEDRFPTAGEMARALRSVGTVDDEIAAQPQTAVMPIQTPETPTGEIEQQPTVARTDEISADAVPTDAPAGTAEQGAIDDETPATADRSAVGGGGASRPSASWIIAVLVAVVFAVLAGLAINAADDGANDPGTTVAPPADGEEFLAELREDPGRFGSRGDELLDELDAVLAEDDAQRRAEAVEQLEVDIFVWVAEGDLDTSVGGLVADLLRRRAP